MDCSQPLRPLQGQEFFQRLSKRRSDVRTAMDSARKLQIALYNDHNTVSSARDSTLASDHETVSCQVACIEAHDSDVDHVSGMQNSSHKISEGDIFCSTIAKSSDHAAPPSAHPDVDTEIEAEFDELTAAARRDAEQKQHTTPVPLLCGL